MTETTEQAEHPLQDALRAAASAAAVGAAVGAARAYSARRTRDDGDDDGDAEEPEAEEQTPPQQEQGQERHDPEPEPHPDRETTRGDLRDGVAQARAVLEELRGVEPESVSSVTPSGDGWLVALEVLEVSRIPDSTDVLATYEVQVDGDGNVRRFERVRRYHRSEAGRGGQA